MSDKEIYIMQHWTKIALITVIVVKKNARIPTTAHHHHHYHHQQVLILAISLWACSCTPHLPCIHKKSTTNDATFTVASFKSSCAPTSHHHQDSNWGRQGSLWNSRVLQVGSVVLPTRRQGIDRGHCAFNWCLPVCGLQVSTLHIFSKCLGGRWQTAQLQRSINIFLHILIRADVSAHVRARMASRSGTIDVCTFTLCMMSITARSFTVEHMQSCSFGFISATKWRSRANTSVSSQIKDTTSPTMHLVILCCAMIVSASSRLDERSLLSITVAPTISTGTNSVPATVRLCICPAVACL